MPKCDVKYGARNQLEAKVTEIKKDQVMCQVKLDVTAPAEIESVMTLDSLEGLGLKKGDKVKAIVKAVHVLIVKE